jgi:hypothetical protein
VRDLNEVYVGVMRKESESEEVYEDREEKHIETRRA